MLPVISHAVNWLKEKEDYVPDYVLLRQPTSPFVQTAHINGAIKLLIKNNADSVISVIPVPGHYNPHWQVVITKNDKLKLFIMDDMKNVIKRRKEITLTYIRDGGIFLCKREPLVGDRPSLYGDDVRAYIMNSDYSIDIDSEKDLIAAEAMLKQLRL